MYICTYTEAIADAAEVRVGHYMGSGQPEKAKSSAYKAKLLAFLSSSIVAAFIWIFGKSIAKFITPDPTLQDMIHMVIPLLFVSQVGLATATVCWAILGAQGRYRLATTITFVGTWFVTIPLSVISILVLNWNLLGPVASLVIGYTVSGATLIGYFLTSDWKYLSEQVVQQHEIEMAEGNCVGKYDDYDWNDLPKKAKHAAKTLGYHKRIWDSDGTTEATEKDWDDLTVEQRMAAIELGYNQVGWDGDGSSSTSS